jgi:hypothetical protein
MPRFPCINSPPSRHLSVLTLFYVDHTEPLEVLGTRQEVDGCWVSSLMDMNFLLFSVLRAFFLAVF